MIDFKEYSNYKIFKYGWFWKNVLSAVILQVAFLPWAFWEHLSHVVHYFNKKCLCASAQNKEIIKHDYRR